jgi:FAD/FMN-containing dehydrogenase
MEEAKNGVRRAVIGSAPLGAAGLGSSEADGPIERVEVPDAWFARRAYCVSGNRLLDARGDGALTARTEAGKIYCPRSTGEIAGVIRSLPAGIAVATVCGGHESSNASTIAAKDAIVLDLAHLTSIEFHQDGEQALVTVGAGVVFRELVDAVRDRHGALPVGTGPGVGVVGYVVNGGLSGYFSRRLGLLGQRVTRLTMVTAAGDILVLTPGDDLFTAMLGAGSALGVVTDVTLRMEHEDVVQAAEQRVISFETRGQAAAFAREALRIQRDLVLPDDSVSMEIVVTGMKALVVTFVFYDGFRGSTAAFVGPLEDLAARLGLAIVAESHWGSWYETAAALWPVINGMKGSPLGMLQHCIGTVGPPADGILDFLCDSVIGEAPLDEAPFSILEIRTLGGAVLSHEPIPSGNCHHRFFCDLITLYDASGKTVAERREIAGRIRRIMEKARDVEGLSVDFSGTHSQPDDPESAPSPPVIFGTDSMAEAVKDMKARVDPRNRFRFHPFAKFL